jgi:geranylgeranyl diphosphate synthase type I
MINKIKNRIEKELRGFIANLDKRYALQKISPVLFKSIKDFISRKGKRVRPILFVIGYLGFSKKIAPRLYTSALSIELLHDFMLVHDDIIDKSETRRGKPSMHKMFNDFLSKFKGIKFCGQDLTIVAGDVMFALGIDAFLSIQEDKARKEAALKKLIEAALYTGSGEFIELLYGTKDLEEIARQDIYKIYDYKTANYTFAAPLAIGAILGGANQKETKKLFDYGICLGRAFQIQDDILGMFSDEKKIGKSTLSDLQEAKKTILIWYAYNHSQTINKAVIKRILSKQRAETRDLLKIREIISSSGALEYAKKEISQSVKDAYDIIARSRINKKYKNLLKNYSQEILSLH